MEISRAGLEALKSHEGLRLKAYPDPESGGDPWTIGYGHTAGVVRGDEITADQAEQFLRDDLAWVYDSIHENVRVPISQNQFDALCSLIFNIGGRAFKDSTLVRKLNAEDYRGAADEFKRWKMAAGHVSQGLTRRRSAERALFLADGATPAEADIPTQPTEAPKPPAGSIPAGEAADYPPPEGRKMPLPAIIGALLPTLIESIPRLGKLFGSGSKVSERNTEAVELAMKIAKEAVGAVNEQETIERIKADPAAAAVATKAIEHRWLELSEGGGGGIEGARKVDAAYAAGPWHAFMHSPSFWIAVLLLPLVYMIVANVVGVLGMPLSDEVRSAISNGVVGLVLGGLAGYYFGQTTSRNRTPAP